MERLSYGDFSLALHGKVIADRIPVNGTIEVTHRCPLACAHCYNNLPMGDSKARAEELRLDEHRRIVDEVVDAGCLWLLYTGGEIFARPDFLDIYIHARRKGLFLTLFTNGILLTPRIADVLAEYRPFRVEITLYGYTQATYERLTGIPGSHARCFRGIELMLERGLPLALKTVGVTHTRDEIGAMQRFAASLGVPFKWDALINPRIDCSHSPLEVRLAPEEIVALDLQDEERVAAWQEFAARSVRPLPHTEHDEEVYHCGGGVDAFSIDPYGGLSICLLSQVEKYDLRGGSFGEGWAGFLRAVRQKRRTRWTKCVSCQIKELCGMCPANAELENGDKETPVDFLCRVAHLRAHVIGVEVPAHGECEYCVGGSRRDAILGSAEAVEAARQRMSRLAPPPSDWQTAGSGPSASVLSLDLPMLATAGGCAPGGCSTCRSC